MFAAKTTVSVTKCDQCNYDKFLGVDKKFNFLLEEIMEIRGKTYKVFLEIDAVFYSMLLDKLLGGKAKLVNKIDRITEIEEAMLIKKFDEMFHQVFQNIKNKSVIVTSLLEASSLCDDLNGNGIVINLTITIDTTVSGLKIFYPADFISGVITTR
jgi:flagellar motor switch protein FliM